MTEQSVELECWGGDDEEKCDIYVPGLQDWMGENGYKLQEKTHEILMNEGVLTIDDLKQFKVEDIDQMCAQLNGKNRIGYGDIVKLKRIIEGIDRTKGYDGWGMNVIADATDKEFSYAL